MPDVPVLPETLPIFVLGEPLPPERWFYRVVKFLRLDGDTEEDEDVLFHRDGERILELDLDTGLVSYLDAERGWNPDRDAALIDQLDAARAFARLREARWFAPYWPPEDRRFELIERRVGGSVATAFNAEAGGFPYERQIDHTIGLSSVVVLGDWRLPVMGRFGRSAAAFVDTDAPVHMQMAWRTVVESRDERALPEAEVWERMTETDPHVVKVDSFLAYHDFTLADGRTALCPAWAFMVARLTAEGVVSPPAGTYRLAADVTLRAPDDPAAPVRATQGPRFGIWSLNGGGLASSHQHASTAAAALVAAGWQAGFLRQDQQARQDAWLADADTHVETLSLASFIGHAAIDRWCFHGTPPPPVDLKRSDLSNGLNAQPDLYGFGDLRWITINGCGPLQDQSIQSATGMATARWRPAFRGLRALYGFGSTIFESAHVLPLFVRRARRRRMVHAWVDAAKHCHSAPRGSTHWAGALWAFQPHGDDAYDDRLPGPNDPAPPSIGTARAQPRVRGFWGVLP